MEVICPECRRKGNTRAGGHCPWCGAYAVVPPRDLSSGYEYTQADLDRAVAKAVKKEREACADIAELTSEESSGQRAAEQIRARKGSTR
jgi:hypothetical protein